MKRYDNYKSSGVEWIGDIPEHWQLKSLRRITKEHRQGFYTSSEYLNEGVKLVRITDLDENGNVSYEKMPYVNISAKDEEVFQVKTGDFLFPRTGSIGLLGLVKEPERAVFASYLINFRFEEIALQDFLKYYFFSQAFKNGIISDLHGGVNQNIHAENIKNQFIAIPLPEEQTAIAKYLDEKTEQIDKLIVGKRRLIELLKEERIAIINHAITKGINEHAKLRPSGIDWLGDIPEHWEVKKLKQLLSKVIDNRGKTPPFGTEGVPMLEVKNITEGKKFPTEVFEKYVQPEVVPNYERDKVQIGDLLISTVGATSGKVVIIKNKPNYFIAQNVVGLRPITSINTLFFYYLLSSDYFYASLQMINKSNTIDNLKVSIFINNICLLPPSEEQAQIVEFIEAKSNEIGSTISKVVKEIELLQEYRTALISEVVTGKIKVV
ncbi:MAG TPA: restriction endonuclease subunit S [Pyrinomonadaceae bacterium]|jgi:type I restriction enzyme S subunit